MDLVLFCQMILYFALARDQQLEEMLLPGKILLMNNFYLVTFAAKQPKIKIFLEKSRL